LLHGFPGDQVVASCSVGGSISLWDTTNWHQIHRFRVDIGAVLRLVWLNDLQLSSGSADGMIRIWNVRSFDCEMVMKGLTGAVLDVAYHSRQRKCLPPVQQTVQSESWTIHSEETKQTLQFNQASIRSVTFSADGQWLASDAYDGWGCLLLDGYLDPRSFPTRVALRILALRHRLLADQTAACVVVRARSRCPHSRLCGTRKLDFSQRDEKELSQRWAFRLTTSWLEYPGITQMGNSIK
jgi:hypothetical protein